MLSVESLKRWGAWILPCILFACASLHAQNLNTTGFTLLQAVTTNLNGAGVRVGQAEAINNGGTNDWEVNPAAIPQPASLFTWYNNGTSSIIYTNLLGTESGHADYVGVLFYGSSGMATNVTHVDNFEADDYFNNYVIPILDFSPGTTDAVVNQSYTFGSQDATNQEELDSYFDNFQTKFKTFFISAACNFSINPSVCAPGTSYDCISVGAYGGDSSIGPTIDNGRCKPDIVAPAPETSFATPQVAGATAVMIQAGRRGDGGSNTNAASDFRTVKALLLNGAVKPAQWMNIPPSPLDYTNGAGVLNVFNSYKQLAAGKYAWNFSTNVPIGAAHLPAVMSSSIPALNGWDFNTNNSSSTKDGVNHYFFNVTNGISGSGFTLTATLVWNRHQTNSAINNLELFLYNAANSNLVAASTSVVDNVQHIYVRQLPQGRYDLQVWKAGGSVVSTNESYALAWEIVSEFLKVKESGTNLLLSWPVYPDRYMVASASTLTPPIVWSTNGIPGPVIMNGQNVVTIPQNNSLQLFRLQTPNF
ncbi:MAG TPA: S8 family serine peptidase [Verrucomicrobiae bacterium]|nr:S8 family serine peptidase [Verrucomicrobiae bacterium]